MGVWRAEGRGKAEPAGSAAHVQEIWLPGNQLVTKEEKGGGGGSGRDTRLPERLPPSFFAWARESPLGPT